jgi:pyruvate/2-oxoacid:ferredoxin oxidoreductase alpha subunit
MGWGSTRGTVREAMELLRRQGVEIEALYPHTLLPMPDKAVSEFLHGKKAILVPELNFSSQFARMIEHRYYRQLDAEDIHVYMLGKEQGIPLKIHEVYDAAVNMIESEWRAWAEEQRDLVRTYEAIGKVVTGEGELGGDDESA